MNILKANLEKEDLTTLLEKAQTRCPKGIVYINETPFTGENDVKRMLTLAPSTVLKTSQGFITYNNPSTPREKIYLIDYDYIENIEFKPGFGRRFHESRKAVIPNIKTTPEWSKIEKAYNKIMYNPTMLLDCKIPKKLHFIYVMNPPPTEMKTRMEAWKAYHQGWDVTFWDDQNIEEFGLENYKQYSSTNNPGERSDIARYEILNRLGGVYVDQDIECLGNIEVFCRLAEFWCGCGLDEYFTAFNGLIGSVPRHPILKELMGRIALLKKPASNAEQVQHNTGPYLLSRVLLEHFNKTWDGET